GGLLLIARVDRIVQRTELSLVGCEGGGVSGKPRKMGEYRPRDARERGEKRAKGRAVRAEGRRRGRREPPPRIRAPNRARARTHCARGRRRSPRRDSVDVKLMTPGPTALLEE